MTIFRFDVSPWILIVAPMWGVLGYIAYRGLTRNEFRERARSGWHRYRTGSFDYWLGTGLNFLFFGAFTFFLLEAIFDGSRFFD